MEFPVFYLRNVPGSINLKLQEWLIRSGFSITVPNNTVGGVTGVVQDLGNIYRHRGRLSQAKEVWWSDVVTAFLLNPTKASELGSTGRFWMSKTLMDLGQLFHEQGQIDQAVQAWQRVIEADLPGAALAKSNISNLNIPAAKF